MPETLKSFLSKIGEDPLLRKAFRANPIKAMADYGLEEVSFDDFASEETMKSLSKLPDRNLQDMEAIAKILEFFADRGADIIEFSTG